MGQRLVACFHRVGVGGRWRQAGVRVGRTVLPTAAGAARIAAGLGEGVLHAVRVAGRRGGHGDLADRNGGRRSGEGHRVGRRDGGIRVKGAHRGRGGRIGRVLRGALVARRHRVGVGRAGGQSGIGIDGAQLPTAVVAAAGGASEVVFHGAEIAGGGGRHGDAGLAGRGGRAGPGHRIGCRRSDIAQVDGCVNQLEAVERAVRTIPESEPELAVGIRGEALDAIPVAHVARTRTDVCRVGVFGQRQHDSIGPSQEAIHIDRAGEPGAESLRHGIAGIAIFPIPIGVDDDVIGLAHAETLDRHGACSAAPPDAIVKNLVTGR